MIWNFFVNRKTKSIFAAVFAFVVLFSLGGCVPAFGQSEKIELVLHGVSMHFNPYQKDSDNWNERNPGFGIRLPLNEKNSFAFQSGVYKNSFARTTVYAGIDWLPIRYRFFGLGAGLGAATGYLENKISPIPVGGPMLQLATPDRISMRFRLFPPIIPGDSGVLSIELSWRLYRKNPTLR